MGFKLVPSFKERRMILLSVGGTRLGYRCDLTIKLRQIHGDYFISDVRDTVRIISDSNNPRWEEIDETVNQIKLAVERVIEQIKEKMQSYIESGINPYLLHDVLITRPTTVLFLKGTDKLLLNETNKFVILTMSRERITVPNDRDIYNLRFRFYAAKAYYRKIEGTDLIVAVVVVDSKALETWYLSSKGVLEVVKERNDDINSAIKPLVIDDKYIKLANIAAEILSKSPDPRTYDVRIIL